MTMIGSYTNIIAGVNPRREGDLLWTGQKSLKPQTFAPPAKNTTPAPKPQTNTTIAGRRRRRINHAGNEGEKETYTPETT